MGVHPQGHGIQLPGNTKIPQLEGAVPTAEDLQFLADETKTDIDFVKKTLGL